MKAPPLPPAAAALAEPIVRVGPRYSALYAGASLALWMGFNVPSQVLIAEQIAEIDPARKETSLAVVLAVGAVVSLIANPLFGALSDATTSRFGRRRPWALAGAVGGAGALLALSTGRSVASVTLGWCLCQLTLNILLAVLMAMVPDRVPVTQRGFVSALAGLSQVLATILGLALVIAVGGGFVTRYAALAVVLVVAVTLLVVGVADEPVPRGAAPPLSVRRLAAVLWVNPVRHRDFGWAWITRFLVMLGYAVGTTYLLYFLRDEVGYERLFPGHGADEGVLWLNAVAGGALLLSIVTGGVISDRLRRRKAFVMASSAIVAVGLLVLAVSPTWPAALVAAGILGAGFGVYLAVDVALITEVLPSAADRGKDLGVINIANTLPQTVAPALCGVLVTHAGGYPTMFAVAAVVTLLGAVLVQPIRGVR
jgi:MFS family permease